MMIRYFLCTLLIIQIVGCSNGTQESQPETRKGAEAPVSKDSVRLQVKPAADFVPEGYRIVDTVIGDLNLDGLDDCVLIIKGTKKEYLVRDETRGLQYRNRRGILVLFNRAGKFELAVRNYSCFASEKEDGGVYYAPELSVNIEKGNLYFQYAHGRYGFWKYTFRSKDKDFELIGYDESSNSGPVVDQTRSVNYLTKKIQRRVNTNQNATGGDEIYRETWENFNQNKPVLLSEFTDVDGVIQETVDRDEE